MVRRCGCFHCDFEVNLVKLHGRKNMLILVLCDEVPCVINVYIDDQLAMTIINGKLLFLQRYLSPVTLHNMSITFLIGVFSYITE